MAIPTTIDTDTELSAVNSILGAIGQSPVTTLGAITEITGEVTYTGKKNIAGTYTRTGSTVTVTSNSHGLVVGETIVVDFTSGLTDADDGDYKVLTVATNAFTIATTQSGDVNTSNLTFSRNRFEIVSSFSTSSEIKASLDGVESTAFTITGSVLSFTATPATDTSVRIWREKEVANTLANPEVSFIYNILTEVNKDVQNEAWVFNKEYNVKISPDSNKHITIPSNVLSYDLHRDDEKFDKNLVRRAGKLWDTIGQTYEFDDDVYLDIVWLWPFEDLPSAFKRYIISRASVRAATQLISNPQLVQLLQIQEAQTRATCLEYECQQGDHSFMGWPEKTSYTPYQPYVVLAR